MYILYTIYKLAILGKLPTDEPIGRHIYTPTNLDHVKTWKVFSFGRLCYLKGQGTYMEIDCKYYNRFIHDTMSMKLI